jgi:hypothetical protein
VRALCTNQQNRNIQYIQLCSQLLKFLDFTDVDVRMQTVFAFLTLLMFKLLYFDVVDVETDNHALKTNKSVLTPHCLPSPCIQI